jgi:hypothetical protein
MELKKLKSLNDLIIEDNPVILKDTVDIMKSLPIRYIPKLVTESVNIKTTSNFQKDEILTLPDIVETPKPNRSSSNSSVKNKPSNNSNKLIPRVNNSSSQVCNTVSSFYPKNVTPEESILESGESIKNDIIKEWNGKKVVSGLAEIENSDKLLIYGNALDILDNTSYYENISEINFEFVDIHLITEAIEKLQNFKKLNTIRFSSNNIVSLKDMVKLKNLDITKICITSNEILKVEMLKDFCVFLFPDLKSFNMDDITNEDFLKASRNFKFFEKCINECETNGQIEDPKKPSIIDSNLNDLKTKYFNFVKENLHIVLDELLNEK